MKRFIALVLSLVMALSLCAPAWATEDYVAYIGEQGYTSLKAAVADGNGKTIDLVGEIDVQELEGSEGFCESGATITFQSKDPANPATLDFTYQAADSVPDYLKYLYGNGGNFTFKNLNINRATVNYTGWAHSASEVYENCNITGLFFGNSPEVSFTNCSFDSNGAEHCAWTWGTEEMTFTNCDFTYGDRAVNCYYGTYTPSDLSTTVTFKKCEFTGATANGAIETNSSAMKAINLIIDDCTVNQGNLWWVSTWDSKQGANTKAVIDGIPAGSVAQVGDQYFKTLAAAVAAADGKTVTLLDNCSGEGIFLAKGSKNITIDFNTKTFTCTGPAVGSAGTVTQAFHLEEGNTVTLKNGTIASAADSNVKMLVQNYCNLTLTNMVLDGTALEGTAPHYVLSNNCGNVVIENTNIKATAGDFAFDTCKYASYAIPTVTVKGSSVIGGAVEASGGKLAVENGSFDGAISVIAPGVAADISVTGGTFSVNPTAYVVDGYAVTEVEGKYVVAVKKADIKDEEVKTDVAVVAPEVKVEVDVEEGTVAADVVETLKTTENAIHLDDTALAATAETIEVAVDEEKVADALVDANIPVVTGDEVSVVVQPYYDVQVDNVEVVTDATTGEVASASIQLNITPMYQVVATTADTAAEIDLEGADKNAVVISAAQPIEKPVTEKVVIKVAIPEALAIDDGNGGFKPLYVTHDKGENGPKYVYVAKVEGNDVDGYTATFENPNGFSSFTLSTENNTVAVVGDMNYATLQGAIDNAGKGAVIEVMVSGLEADITAPFSFKLKLAEGVDEPTFNVAKGYTMSKWYVNGVYTYIVQSASAGGYAPSTTPEKVVTSADTFDAGIALYVGMSVMAAAGSAVVLKKRED